MRQSIEDSIKIQGQLLKTNFDQFAQNMHQHQHDLLLRILNTNASTEYGRKYDFSSISSMTEYEKRVPIVQYKQIETYINKIKAGHKHILFTGQPTNFHLTSSTSDKPKYIPVTHKKQQLTASIMHQWLYRAYLDHPGFLNQAVFLITSPEQEGEVSSGMPYGSISGLIHQSLPESVKNAYVVPPEVINIKNYDLKYYLMARFSIEKEVSFIATPNPVTLIRIANVVVDHQQELIQSIREGVLCQNAGILEETIHPDILSKIKAKLKPNPVRAQFLQQLFESHKRLLPCHYWPQLKLIGCWLGGSVGIQAEKLADYFGDKVPKRDLGYLASEGCFSLPYQDNTPAGILAIENNYYEFIHESQIDADSPEILMAHELKQDECYKVIITNESGLYRYDIEDIIQVQGFYHQVPVITFIRKAGAILNITGEKVHLNHFVESFSRIKRETGLDISQFRVVPDYDKLCYDIYIAPLKLGREDKFNESFIMLIDNMLSDINNEYREKRKSKRLKMPRIHIMNDSWEENVTRAIILSGRRDSQFKWYHFSNVPVELDQLYIEYSISLEI
jgi:hypothetical protein